MVLGTIVLMVLGVVVLFAVVGLFLMYMPYSLLLLALLIPLRR